MKLHRNLSQVRDYLAFLVLYAPDEFPTSRQLTLKQAFDDLSESLERCEGELSETQAKVVASTVQSARHAYETGDSVKGAHLLQDLMQFIKGT
jgi:hypothetical protein